MTYRLTICLLAGFLALSFIAYWDEWFFEKERTTEIQNSMLLPLDIKVINGLKYNLNNETVIINKNLDNWYATYPKSLKLDKNLVESFLTTLLNYRAQKTVSTSSDTWAQYGISNENNFITLFLSNGSDLTLLVGADSAVGYEMFVATSKGPNVFLGSRYLRLALNKKLQDFRSRKLIDWNINNLKRLSFWRRSQETIELTKDDHDIWINSKKGKQKASQKTVEDFVYSLNTISATDFYDYPYLNQMDETFSPDRLSYKISWQTKDYIETLSISLFDNLLVAKKDSEEIIYSISFKELDKLLREPSDFMTASDLEKDNELSFKALHND